MVKLNRPIIVNCPPFNEQSGGCIVLHYLTHRLRGMGVEAYAFPLFGDPPSRLPKPLRDLRRQVTIRKFIAGRHPFPTHPALDTPMASLADLRRGIGVYPEIVAGNPLGFARVVRWILFTPDPHGPGQPFDRPVPGEEVFYFQAPFIEGLPWIPRENALRLQWHREDLFHDPGAVERPTICRMIRKGTATADLVPPGAEGAVLLDGRSNAEIAEVFKRSRLFYCHDPYSMYCDYAAFCGCLPIVVPPPGMSLDAWRPEPDRRGIAFGDSPEQLDWALRTREGLFERIRDLKRQEDAMLEHFVARLAAAFN